MAAARKLQTEIDKTLKKVQEGIEEFDELWEKLHSSDNSNQKEKFESELKKEIKKLQRYRDQVKTWIQSSEVKEKNPLIDARKAVEREMERFKICERETKTKAFSREGLQQSARLDPKNKARQEERDWLNATVDQLNSQIDEAECELEAGSSKKKKNNQGGRLNQLEEIVTRHRYHIQKLEHLLRLLDNEQVDPEELEELKEYLEDYIERSQVDPDDFIETEYFYEGLEDKFESSSTLQVNTFQTKKEEKKAKREAEPADAGASRDNGSARGHSVEDGGQGNHAGSGGNDREGKGTGSKHQAGEPAKVESHWSASSTPALASATRRATGTAVVSKTISGPAYSAAAAVGTASDAPSATGKPAPTAAQLLQGDGSGKQRRAVVAQEAHPPVPNTWENGLKHASVEDGSRAGEDGKAGNRVATAANALAGGAQVHFPGYQDSLGFRGPTARAYADGQDGEDRSQGGVEHLLRKAEGRQAQPALPFGHGSNSMPQDQDRKWNRRTSLTSQGHQVGVPASYPRQAAPALLDPNTYQRFEPDTLFFAFYYQPGTYHQYLASKALKKKNWRFNKKHHTWFQRLKEPNYVASEHEQGSYVWFDYVIMHEDTSPGWCPRVKDNFVFEYADLE